MTDRDWEKWGASEPYFGVLSSDRFRAQNLSEEGRQEFFESGERYVQALLTTIRRVYDREFAPEKIMDFGCGVGRLLIPFARRCYAVGVDVSPSMLREAKRNCDIYEISNVTLVQSDDTLSSVNEEFDIVSSCLVLQHIPWNRGHRIIEELARRVRPGGVLAIQFYYGCTASRMVRFLVRLRYKSSAVNVARNLWRGRPASEPAMQLHIYDMPAILQHLRRAGFADIHQQLGSRDKGVFEDTILFARRSNNGSTST